MNFFLIFQKTKSTVATFERLVKVLKDEILAGKQGGRGWDSPTEEVAIVFGATPVSVGKKIIKNFFFLGQCFPTRGPEGGDPLGSLEKLQGILCMCV